MGKGDWRRPTLEDDAKVTTHWCESVGHRMSAHGAWCVNCGTPMLEVVKDAAPAVGEL